MTILASGPGVIVCGSLPGIHRLRGRRLPSNLVPWVGTPYADVPTPELEQFMEWMVSGPYGWYGHAFELFDIEDALTARYEAEGATVGQV